MDSDVKLENAHGQGRGRDYQDFGFNNGNHRMETLFYHPSRSDMQQPLPYNDPLFDLSDAAARNRNRGNYRCSKCGEPKKGHVCSVVLSNYKCNRCRLPKKSCTCSAPQTRSIAVQVELDEHMTIRNMDRGKLNVFDSDETFSTYNQENS